MGVSGVDFAALGARAVMSSARGRGREATASHHAVSGLTFAPLPRPAPNFPPHPLVAQPPNGQTGTASSRSLPGTSALVRALASVAVTG